MYNVVEFDDGGGGVSLIRREWLTPKKLHCMWPPHKLMRKFKKCIDGSIIPDDTWELFKIKRVFYETDNLAKAREKAKQAEIESEVNSDDTAKTVRQRKKTRKIYDSDTSPDNSDDNTIVYPTPPANKLGTTTKISKTQSAVSKTSSIWRASTGDILKHTTPGTPTDEEYSEKYQKQVAATEVSLQSFKANKQANKHTRHHTPSGTSTSDEEYSEKYQNKVAATEVSLQSLSSLDLTVTPFLKETPNSQALDAIAKHLARIQADIRELQISQQEILKRIRSCSSTPLEHSLPDEITLPCDDNEELTIIETWIKTTTENKKLLVTYLSLVGGSKVPVIIRRILEKIFTNKLAILCNWTGKNRKIPLKDLELIKIIRDAVRQNQIAANATDAEIHEVISNWFRFTKDRNGGREARRVKQ